jgi:alpha-glucosidase (family GH31 glycosyl hydrolase)
VTHRGIRATLLGVALASIATAPAAAETVAADSGALRATVGKDPWSLALVGRNGRTVLREFPGLGAGPSGTLGFRSAGGVWHHAARVVSSHRSHGAYVATLATDDPAHSLKVRISRAAPGAIDLDADLLGPATGTSGLGIGFRARSHERYLGFGERSNAVDQRGNTVEDYSGEGAFQPEERPFINGFVPTWGFRARDDGTYFPMPWLLSTAGYGVLIRGSQVSYFRLASDRSDAWSLEVTAAPADIPQSLTAPPPTHLALRFFAGPRPRDVVRRLTASIGRQPPPAPWFLGPWFQPTSGTSDGRLLRKADVPVSVAQTYTHYLPCGAQQGDQAGQRELTKGFHGLGYAVTTYFNPMICTSYEPVYDQASEAGALTETRTGSPYVYRYNQFVVSQFDFSSAVGRDMYGDLLREALRNGYDGWMEDFGEYMPPDGVSANGVDGTVMHNRYPRLYHCSAYRSVRSAGRPVLRFVRSGWTGAARCAPVVWGGDPTTGWGYDGLRSAVQNGLTMGLSGIGVWGSDIGGFFSLGTNQLTPELLTRWVQLGAVSGVMRTEADGFAIPSKPRPEVFDHGQLPNWRRYSKLRTELYPYIDAAARAYRRTGMPIMRSLALAYPRDSRAVAREDEFLFGPDLLAAPVLEPEARTRSLYLPRGVWVDVWRSLGYQGSNGSFVIGAPRLLTGRRSVTLPAPLRQLPLLARAGTMLPMLPADVDTLAPYGRNQRLVHRSDTGGRLKLLAWPRGSSSAQFLDGGRVRSREGRASWTLRFRDSRTRSWSLQASMKTVRSPFVPCTVSLDGRPLPSRAWSYDGATGVLRARFAAHSGAELTVSGRQC